MNKLNWEEEFDKEFLGNDKSTQADERGWRITQNHTKYVWDIKNFIKFLLAEQKLEVIDKDEITWIIADSRQRKLTAGECFDLICSKLGQPKARELDEGKVLDILGTHCTCTDKWCEFEGDHITIEKQAKAIKTAHQEGRLWEEG